MAPRRQKKVGLKRIDAALDALLPYGFSKETICSTINKLLKVYDDNAAWYLIEEGSYSLVIETILEEQKQEAREIHNACFRREEPGKKLRPREFPATLLRLKNL
ncbi:uncharacterized protein LOC135649568 isoform X3 [Musa acuminata AAA Group]|uniref:uncharacterized protein LOC103996873 isoform X3 n=1 Tax=Musa acuminata AAA Group TaxID=214697 RepID=UPI0008A0C2EF|nr:PREDICTED: uncharacterized protein LOC103996873 isoform X4 [Musa acuminata subsp. malaccensis]